MQVGFFEFVAVPCFESFVDSFPRLSPVKDQLLKNLQHWITLDKLRAEADKAGGDRPSKACKPTVEADTAGREAGGKSALTRQRTQTLVQGEGEGI